MNWKKLRSWVRFTLALSLSCTLLLVSGVPVAGIPALASVFHPYKGIWTDLGVASREVSNQTIHIQEVDKPVRIIFETDGTPHVKAETDRDAWVALGYLHASFRLHQMDLMRRQGSGRLAEVAGRSALPSDLFQRQLGLSQHAKESWNQLDSETKEVLKAYADGVNQVIKKKIKSNELPFQFKMMEYEPETWKPQDTLILTDVLTQMMSFTKLPIYYSILSETLGIENTMEFMPVLPPNEQQPFDTSFGDGGGEKKRTEDALTHEQPNKALTSHLQVLQSMESLPEMAVHENPSSNGWAVTGDKSASGKPILAGDPHLDYSMPSIWYQVHVESPGYSFGGATVPGIPAVLIGQNKSAAWTMTSGQNQQTFYYEEKTDPKKPNQYFSNGKWRAFEEREENISIKGGESEKVVIKSSIHGPILTQEGITLAVDWIGGNLPSTNIESFIDILGVQSFTEFKEALRPLSAPIMNFLYADSSDIGIITAGKIPIFKQGTQPWLPMSGTGEHEHVSWVPYEDHPQSLNPPEKVVSSANQRQAGLKYPYYLGTSAYFDPGYRAKRIFDRLNEEEKITPELFASLQHESYDPLAAAIVPKLLQALEDVELTEIQKKVLIELENWDYEAEENSAAASIWWVFWEQYLQETFNPWWEAYHVPVKDHPKLAVSPKMPSLVMNLEKWTLDDPGNPYFSNPLTGEKRQAPQVMQKAFSHAIKELSTNYGENVQDWNWNRLHTRFFPALTGIRSLGYGPIGSSGNLYSLDSVGVRESVHGPTWRMIVDWGNNHTMAGYPGGQSENPSSQWFLNQMNPWWKGEYKEFIDFNTAASSDKITEWRLQ